MPSAVGCRNLLGLPVAPQGRAEVGAVLVTFASRCSNSSLVRSPGPAGWQGRWFPRPGRPPPGRRTSRRRCCGRPPGGVGGREPLHEPAVDGFQPVQRCLGLRDLDLGRGETQLPGRSASQRAKKVLPQPYSPRTALNTRPRHRPCANPRRLPPRTVPGRLRTHRGCSAARCLAARRQ